VTPYSHYHHHHHYYYYYYYYYQALYGEIDGVVEV